jgi:predicted MFS family arabinose efflux permease
MTKQKIFTGYEVFMIAILTFIQFTVILDFMVLSPLGAILMPTLKITPPQFGMVVSAYAFSAGGAGLLAAGFADKFDRKKMLLFFYTGFVLGTALCAWAPDYHYLLIARIVTGVFAGVIGSIAFAIITDLFRMEVRGRVMGFVQMAFAGSQVLGIPIGLILANRWGWHAPFTMIVAVSAIVGVVIVMYMKPVTSHLLERSKANAVQHLLATVQKPHYLRAFAATTLLATGGFMLMPFASAFSVNNLHISLKQLPLLYMITGIFSMATGPFIGRLSDAKGKYPVFIAGSILAMVMAIIYCNLGVTPLWIVIVISCIMFTGVSSRIISSSALLSAVPVANDRGAFMSINASVQQIAGGIATFIAGLIVVETPSGYLDRYDMLGYTVAGAMILTIAMMYSVNRYVQQQTGARAVATAVPGTPVSAVPADTPGH